MGRTGGTGKDGGKRGSSGTNLMQLHDGVHAHARVEPAVREAKPLRIPTNGSRKRCVVAKRAAHAALYSAMAAEGLSGAVGLRRAGVVWCGVVCSAHERAGGKRQ